MPTTILETIDRHTRAQISALIHETVSAAPGIYEIPALCKIVEAKSIWNAKTIHFVVDDQFDFGALYLDKHNRLCTTNYLMPSPRQTSIHDQDNTQQVWTSSARTTARS